MAPFEPSTPTRAASGPRPCRRRDARLGRLGHRQDGGPARAVRAARRGRRRPRARGARRGFAAREGRGPRARCSNASRSPLPTLTVVTIQGLAFHVVGERFERLGYVAPPTVLSARSSSRGCASSSTARIPSAWPVFGSLLGLRGFADEVRQFVIRAQERSRSPDDIEREAAERGLAGWDELAAFLRTLPRRCSTRSSEVDFAGARRAGLGRRGCGRAPVRPRDGRRRPRHDLRGRAPPGRDPPADASSSPAISTRTCSRSRARPTSPSAASPNATRAPRRPRSRPRHRPGARVDRGLARRARLGAARRGRARAAAAPRRRPGSVARARGRRSAPAAHASRGSCAPSTTRASLAGSPTRGSPAAVPATCPFVLALRWLVAGPQERDSLIEPVLTSELGRLSPASARTLLRLAARTVAAPREALALHDLAEPEDAKVLTGARLASSHGPRPSHASVLDAFRVLWLELPFAADLVERAETDHHALRRPRRGGRALGRRRVGGHGGRSVDRGLPARRSARRRVRRSSRPGDEGSHDEVQVLTAHAAAGREFDTVIVLDALEGDFPSLSRPESMFDLATLEGAIARSEVNRRRLADERRLFGMVRSRARRRVVLTATDPHGDESSVTLTSRFVEELGLPWRDVPAAPFAEPVSTFEAASAWRRELGDPNATAAERLAGLDALLALGDDPARWWFQREWTDLSAVAEDALSLSYSRLSTLENCELQFVLSERARARSRRRLPGLGGQARAFDHRGAASAARSSARPRRSNASWTSDGRRPVSPRTRSPRPSARTRRRS